MPTTAPPDLRTLAAVLVRVGLNLQRGQPLLIAEPHELQGVARGAAPLVAAVAAAAAELGTPEPAVIWGDGAALRGCAARGDWEGLHRLVAGHARRMRAHLADGGAFLFLLGSQPELLAGLPAAAAQRLHQVSWNAFGPVMQRLVAGATQWTLAPAPSPEWAAACGAPAPGADPLAALWATVLAACRCTDAAGAARAPDEAIAAWHAHLARLAARREALNARRLTTVRFRGAGTDLTLALPRRHRWCDARLTSRAGVPFVANLPTEEVFTAPHRRSAEGTLHLARPVRHGGGVITGLRLEFRRGRVVHATAATNEELLHRLLATDPGARRLGELALVGPAPDAPDAAGAAWSRSPRLHHHILLDENATHHVALGDAYRSCLRGPFPFALNRSFLHVDLPLEAAVEFPA